MQLNNLLQIRGVLLAHINDKVSANVAYRIMKYLKATESEEDFYFKKAKEIADEYGERDEDGKLVHNKDDSVNIKHDKIDECKALLADLANTDVDVPDTKFTIEDLSGLQLTVKEMYTLDNLITP